VLARFRYSDLEGAARGALLRTAISDLCALAGIVPLQEERDYGPNKNDCPDQNWLDVRQVGQE
jgi:hypothetical protein